LFRSLRAVSPSMWQVSEPSTGYYGMYVQYGYGNIVNPVLAYDGNTNNPHVGTVDFGDHGDITPPTVTLIWHLDGSPSGAAQVRWYITFSEPVTNVDVSDFAVVTGGQVSGASVVSVTGSDTYWVVTANTGTGDGTLRLDIVA